MSKPIIHILTVAGSERDVATQLGLGSGTELIELTRRLIGSRYRVTADPVLVEATIDERHGGRSDDRRRARSLGAALANDRVVAVLALRGGAWLARILPDVDFDVLRKRDTGLFLFGFSELSTLINIVAGYRKAKVYCDIAPGYLLAALTAHALGRQNAARAKVWAKQDHSQAKKALGWAKRQFHDQYAKHVEDVVGIIEGRGSSRQLKGTLVAGTIKDGDRVKVIGGCMSVVVTLLGTPFHKCFRPRGRWIALEDIREPVYRLDRYFAHLKLTGAFDQCAGLLLGDFHFERQDQTDHVLELLRHHLPRRRRLPIIARCNFGHCYPCAPLPLNQPLRAEIGGDRTSITLTAPSGSRR